MKQTLIMLAASGLAFTAPALAKPGNGQGQGHGNPHAQNGVVHSNHGKGTLYGYGQGGCPPGLAKKPIPCVPPGQAKVGQVLATGLASPMTFGQIPYSVRNAYDLSSRGRYYYGNGYLYRVDPTTMVVQQAVAAVLGR